MQGQRSSMGSLPETISFDLNPMTTDSTIEQPVFWNSNIQNYTHNMVPEYNNGSIYLHSASQAQNLSGWNIGEASSSGTQNYSIHNAIRGVDLNQTTGETPYSPLFMQSAINSTFPQNLNMGIEVRENNNNNFHVMEENLRGPSSASGGHLGEEISTSEAGRLSCKRKAIEGHMGQSSSGGSSSYFQPTEANDWYATHFGSNTSSTSLGNPFHTSSQDQLNTRLGSSSSGNISQIPHRLNVAPNLESTRRSHRVRTSSSSQISPSPSTFPNGTISGDSNVASYPQSSRSVPLNNFPGTRTPQSSRWSRGSSSRSGQSMSFAERVIRPNEEPESQTSQRFMPEIPIFVPTGDVSRNLPQIPPHMIGNVSSSVHPVTSSGLPHRTPPRPMRRLSNYVRRLSESGGQGSNSALQPGSSSQQLVASSGAGGNNHGDRLSRLRSLLLLERQLDSALGGSSSLRTAAAGPERRRLVVSEIRNVLDLIRRGDGLRLEDVVFLDQSVFAGMADIHDQHRDMRLDVDNMSYEELLALEERMGNVSTGLSEETILKGLKQRKFFSIAMGSQSEVEPCCICREEYDDGEDIGTVECGHEFHSGCIKQWLMQKNSCPICKTAALSK